MLETLNIILRLLCVIELGCSVGMMLGGFKWPRGLIGTVSIRIGIIIGVELAGLLMENTGLGVFSLIVIPIAAYVISEAAYKDIGINHMLAGMLFSVKVLFLLFSLYLDLSDSTFNGLQIGVIIMLSILAAIIIERKFNNHILLLCMSYIGASNFVAQITEIMDNGFWSIVPDIDELINMDIDEIALAICGIEIATFFEALTIIVLFVASYRWQKNQMEKEGIELSDTIIDDRK